LGKPVLYCHAGVRLDRHWLETILHHSRASLVSFLPACQSLTVDKPLGGGNGGVEQGTGVTGPAAQYYSLCNGCLLRLALDLRLVMQDRIQQFFRCS
jgi:hypothetical protein